MSACRGTSYRVSELDVRRNHQGRRSQNDRYYNLKVPLYPLVSDFREILCA